MDITANRTDITGNRTDIMASRTDITNNLADITYNRMDITGNRTDTASNRTDITSNETDITSNRTDIPANRTGSPANRPERYLQAFKKKKHFHKCCNAAHNPIHTCVPRGVVTPSPRAGVCLSCSILRGESSRPSLLTGAQCWRNAHSGYYPSWSNISKPRKPRKPAAIGKIC
ncbi:hypothetical protein METBIDRAFT_221486 [Metschnikowia bicuspidata var. bicuspidata NRRL YB-4993]|uniref:Uncharacterized protein n=1 Tax=Metschnikowia bicuspidata var. bicuspidata NRRL YB-4993 TaxID=869754 RepID=A0A1A0H5R7_9ASCO|nr:hypothetical protein METBIDRAFT_221486 [Metschnikowia bicuspidata var. bicuspidata NRRL YB-4993]OBA19300.1 hypothetical protein METBIDRAFT_221486 [Metschnikowia bicuspidata var. bicuspidata NRRL YB-4993]